MALSNRLNKTLKANFEDESDSEACASDLERSAPSISGNGENGGADYTSANEARDDLQSSESDDDQPVSDYPDVEVEQDLNRISFGALAKAQDSLTNGSATTHKRKRGQETSGQQEEKLRALRERLQELKERKLAGKPQSSHKSARQESSEDDESSSDSDSDQDQSGQRTSKHAPAIQSTKKPVSRKRIIIETHKPAARDPRFTALAGSAPKNETSSKKYAFLKEYRESEVATLKTAMVKSKDASQKEELKKQLHSLESRAKAQAAKDKQQEVIREHRKKEKEAISQGKKPFYLKKSEVKEQALVEKYKSMSGKQREKAIQRRRKKMASREKKAMPAARRTG